MAVFEIWDVRGRYDHPINYAMNEEKTNKINYTEEQLAGLQDVIHYAANSKKTTTEDFQVFVTGIGCNPIDARNQMALLRKQFNHQSEIIAFHGFQSFAHGEVSPEIAHEIGVRFAQKMWGDNFQVICTTHLNTNSIHNHFVINATALDGKRFHDNKEHLKKARATSDEFCREYGLSVIENPDGRKAPIHLYKQNQAGMPTRYNIIKEAIDDAIAHSFSREDFFKQLDAMGYKYDFRESRKYATITPRGYEKSVRIHKLGDEYSRERIFGRISENPIKVKFLPISPPTKNTGYRNITTHSFVIAKKRGGLRGLYLHYCYLLGILPKTTQRTNARIHYLMRDDLMKIDRISAQVKLLYKYKIDTVEQLSSFKESITKESGTLIELRKSLWSKTRSAKDPSELSKIKDEISKCSARLKEIRWDVKHCDEIASRSVVITENIKEIEKEKTNRKDFKNESFRRRR